MPDEELLAAAAVRALDAARLDDGAADAHVLQRGLSVELPEEHGAAHERQRVRVRRRHARAQHDALVRQRGAGRASERGSLIFNPGELDGLHERGVLAIVADRDGDGVHALHRLDQRRRVRHLRRAGTAGSVQRRPSDRQEMRTSP